MAPCESGAEIVVLPSGQRSTVRAVEGREPAVRVQLVDELDVGRGDMIVAAAHTPIVTTELTATVAWLGEPALSPGARVVVKHTTRTVKAIVTRLHDRLDVTSLEREPGVAQLAVNEIGTVDVHRPPPRSPSTRTPRTV